MSTAPLSRFPEDIRQAHARWQQTGAPDALDQVVLAIVAHHLPGRTHGAPLVYPPDSARMVEDLGYDSLTIAEIVFFIEDLYEVTISTQDLRDIRTIAELRAFVRTKISSDARPDQQP